MPCVYLRQALLAECQELHFGIPCQQSLAHAFHMLHLSAFGWHVLVDQANFLFAQRAVAHPVFVQCAVRLPTVQSSKRERLAIVYRTGHVTNIEAVLLPDTIDVHEDPVLQRAIKDECIVRPLSL